MRLVSLLLPGLLLLAAPAAAQRQPEWRLAAEANVILHPFRYEPREIRLEAGRPVIMHFVNNGRATLSFRASGFFAASNVRRSDRRLVEGGGFRLAPGERLRVALVPARGRYGVHSGYIFHRLRGMTARIVVE